MPLVTTDPLKQVLSGILNGYGVADMLRGRAMQEARLAEDQKRAEQDAQLKDINVRSLLSQITRPVDEAGLVSEQVALPDLGGVPQETLDAGTFDYRRKAQSPITYRSPSGEVIRGELLSREEQIDQQLKEKAAMSQIDTLSALAKLRGQRELEKVDLPGYGAVPKEAVPFYTSREDNQRTVSEGAKNRETQVAIAEQNRKNQQEIAKLRVVTQREIAEKNANSRERAARIRASARGSADPAMVDAIMANPNLYNDLTPTQKSMNAVALAERGFGFGKPPTEGAMKQMAETQAAIASLQDLRQTLKDNEQYIGPLRGLQAANPWSDGRKAQAQIDLVRQRVGKALEGGVLRKEDEDKYKKILATLRDEPSTAIFKVDNLMKTLERDMSIFVDTQQKNGRKLTAPGKTGGGGVVKWGRGPDGRPVPIGGQ